MTPIPRPIGFLGAGNMAEALINGILSRGLAHPGQVVISDVRPERLDDLRMRMGVVRAESNAALAKACKTIVFSVKPQNVRELCAEIGPHAPADALYISICAGVPTRIFETLLTGANSSARVVRVMPNTPAMIGFGASALAAGANATPEDLLIATRLFEAVGVTIQVREEQLDAITGLSGTGPAYFFLMIEALIEAGIEQGLSPEESVRMVKQTAYGASRLALESEKTPGELRRAVTSPGGTTAAALEVLQNADFMSLMRRCVARATERSRELGRMV